MNNLIKNNSLQFCFSNCNGAYFRYSFVGTRGCEHGHRKRGECR